MKKLLLILAAILLFPTPTQAHLAGQPPFFKVNGNYSNLYPVPLTSLDNFNLPQDIAPDNYLVNQEIAFDFDTANLPAPPEVIKKTKFMWEFGDGGKGEGLSQKHTYTKPGSYFLIVKVDDGTVPEPQLLQSTFLNILPNHNYLLPKAVITVNGLTPKDPLTDILTANFKETLNFDATKSQVTNGQIVSYIWDFGDGKTDTQAKTTHQYTSDLNQTFPVLRIKDSNGFISDTYAEIENDLNKTNETVSNKTSAPSTKSPVSNNLLIIAAIILLIIIIYFIIKRKRKSKTPQNRRKNF